MSKTIVPEIHWAQRSSATEDEKNVVFLTVILPDIHDQKVNLKSDSVEFNAESHEATYAAKVNFYDEIDVDNSSKHTTGRGLFMVLRKKNKQAEYWPRLTKEKAKYPYIKTDFDKWVDEDEQEEQQANDPMQGMDLSQLAAMSGQGGGGAEGLDMASLAQQMGQQ